MNKQLKPGEQKILTAAYIRCCRVPDEEATKAYKEYTELVKILFKDDEEE